MKIFKIVLLCLVTSLVSCSKDDTTSNNNSNSVTDGFFYAENGATANQTVSTPYANATFKSIFAVHNGATVVEINLSSLAVGSYTIDNATNVLTYLKPGSNAMWLGTSGSVTITANANNKLSGSFSIPTGTGITGVNSLSGTFTNIPIQ